MPNSYQGQPNTRRFGLSFHFTSFFISIHSGRILRSTPGSQVWAYVPASGLHGSSAWQQLTKHHVSLDTCDVTWLRARPIGGIQKQIITTCAEPLNEHNGSYRRQRGYGRGGVPACAYNGFTTETESFAERETEMGWTRAMPAKRGSTKPARRFCGPSKPISRLSRTMADSCADSETSNTLRRAYSTWAGRPALPLV